MCIGLIPDTTTVVDIGGRTDGIENPKDHDQGPGEGNQDAVDIEAESAVGVTFSKGVDYGW